jgi:hypothetical protein
MDQQALFTTELATDLEATQQAILDRIAHEHARDVLTNVIVAAKAGDIQAAKIVLDRIWPIQRTPRINGVLLKPVRSASEVRNAMGDVFTLVSSGRITPAEGDALMGMLKDLFTAHTVEDVLPFKADGVEVSDPLSIRAEITKRFIKVLNARNGNAAALSAPEADNATASTDTQDVIEATATTALEAEPAD